MPSTIYPSPGDMNYVNTGGAQTLTGAKTFLAGSATSIPIVVQGATSQSANLQEWRNNSGTVLASIYAGGALFMPHGGYFTGTSGNGFGDAPGNAVLIARSGGTGTQPAIQDWQATSGSSLLRVEPTGQLTHLQTSASNYGIAITPQSANTVTPLHVRNGASSTANIQEWANSAGTVLASVDNQGLIGSSLQIKVGDLTQNLGTYLQVAGTNANARGLVIRGAASQSVNLQEWQTNAGTTLGFATADGGIVFGGSYLLGGTSANNNTFHVAALVQSPGNRGIVVRGAASQSANLQEWQNSTPTALAWVDSAGNFSAQNINGTVMQTPSLYINTDFTFQSNGAIRLRGGTTGEIPLNIAARAAQTANLTQWQNQSGTVLTAITPSGEVKVGGGMLSSNSGSPLLALQNVVTAPTNNYGVGSNGGGYLYASGGALMWRGGNGSVIQIAAP